MEQATKELVNTGAIGAFATIMLLFGGWVVKRLMDQQQQFFDQLLKRLDAHSDKLGELADAVREVVIGDRRARRE